MNPEKILFELAQDPMRAADMDVLQACALLPVNSREFQSIRNAVRKSRALPVSVWDLSVKRQRMSSIERDASSDGVKFSDAWNSAQFVDAHADRLRFINERGWYRFAKGRWEYRDMEALSLAVAFSQVLLSEVIAECSPDDRVRAVQSILSRRTAENIVWMSRSYRQMTASLDDCDRNDFALNVSNGTIDLTTGRLRPHVPAELHTRRVDVDYDEAARCPQWKAFLDRVQPDPAVQKYLQRMMGYNLTGAINEQIFNIWHGTGANGKSTALEVLQHCLGDYSRILPSEMLLNRTHEPHPTERAQLMGLRLAAFEETKKGKAFDENTVKQLVGQGTLTARFMRQDNFEFKCTHKVIVCTNHRPKVSDCSHGFWRRTHLLPWVVEIPEAEKDRGLKQKLRDEAPGILRWIVEGCLEYQRVGLAPPAAVTIATAEYQAESDAMGLFISERTRADTSRRVRAGELFKAWKEWCEERGEYAGSQTTFGESLRGRFKKLKSCGIMFYTGVRLWQEGEGDEEEGSPPLDDPENLQGDQSSGKAGTVETHYTYAEASNIVNTSEVVVVDRNGLLSLDSLNNTISDKSLTEVEGTGTFPEDVPEIVLDADGGFDL